MTNENRNLNEIKRQLFGNLSIKTIDEKLETVTFMRETDFGATHLYFEYSFKDNAVNRIYKDLPNNRKRFFYDKEQKILDLPELNKHNLRK